MSKTCQKCGTQIATHKTVSNRCPICNFKLSAGVSRQPAPTPANGNSLPEQTLGSKSVAQRDSLLPTRPQRGLRVRHRMPEDLLAPHAGLEALSNQTPHPTRIQPAQSLIDSYSPTQMPGAARFGTAANELQGTIQSVEELDHEPEDFDIFRFLASLLLAADLVIFFGTAGLFLIIIVLVLIIVAVSTNAFWAIGFLGSLLQGIFYLFTPFTNLFRRERRTQPVRNYNLRTSRGEETYFRLKGQLRGAYPKAGDQVSIRVRQWSGVNRFVSGVNLKNGIPFQLPLNPGVPLFLLMVGINLFLYNQIASQIPR